MHHGVRVRVIFRQSTNHSRNDGSSSSTSWSHHVHFFRLIKYIICTRNVSERSVQHPSHSFARELEEKKHPVGPISSSAVAAAAAATEDAENTSEHLRIQQQYLYAI